MSDSTGVVFVVSETIFITLKHVEHLSALSTGGRDVKFREAVYCDYYYSTSQQG
jgi:hypothetical protein